MHRNDIFNNIWMVSTAALEACYPFSPPGLLIGRRVVDDDVDDHISCLRATQRRFYTSAVRQTLFEVG